MTLNPQLSAGLEQSRVLLLVPVSQLSTINSQPPCTAVHRDPANAGRRFIPFLLGDCVLPDTLRHCKVVDFREESEAAFAEVPATGRPETLPVLLASTRANRGRDEKPVHRKTVTVS